MEIFEMNLNNPILNSPYLEPLMHYDTDRLGSLDYSRVRIGRRIFKEDTAVIPTRQSGQKEAFEWYEDIEDYYRIRGLIPANMEHRLENLNARLVITNYHTFEPKILQGNKRSPFDGKVDLRDKYEYSEWHFIEVANDIRNIKNQLIEKIQSI
jgi:ABC-type uncharacterized transport system involved in gliding motility auxiliary subunit